MSRKSKPKTVKRSPQSRKQENGEHRRKCGFCTLSFRTVQDLYTHQQREHDPDGIIFSELGLPK